MKTGIPIFKRYWPIHFQPKRSMMSTSAKRKFQWKHLLSLPIFLLGMGVLVMQIQGEEEPLVQEPTESAQPIRYIEVPSVDLVPRVLGYGNAQPARVWEAIAEVSGRVIEMHPKLKKGAQIRAGEILLQIDPLQYQLMVSQDEANVASIESQLEEMDLNEKNTQDTLKIEKEILQLQEVDLKRSETLVQKNAYSEQKLDQDRKSTLLQVQKVMSLENTLRLLPTQRNNLKKQLDIAKAKLEISQLNLKNTIIRLPFDARIAQVNVEIQQFSRQGDILVVADSIDKAEVTAQISLERMSNLFKTNAVFLPSQINPLDFNQKEITSRVRLVTGTSQFEWPAQLLQFSDAVDIQARTIGVIVGVDSPYASTASSMMPPLIKNMYVEVELQGKILPNQQVIPRSALHDSQVYLVDDSNRLEIRDVTTDFFQTNFVVLKEGVQSGERVIVSNLVPAIEGMLLAPSPDPNSLQTLLAEAQGGGKLK